MNLLLFSSIISIFLGCNHIEPKFKRKEIDNKDIVIKWYYYSHISNVSPDIVEVEKDGVIKEIYRAIEVVVDVSLKEKNIILKVVKPTDSSVLTKKVEDEIFGYKIILDTTGTYGELFLVPDGQKQ